MGLFPLKGRTLLQSLFLPPGTLFLQALQGTPLVPAPDEATHGTYGFRVAALGPHEHAPGDAGLAHDQQNADAGHRNTAGAGQNTHHRSDDDQDPSGRQNDDFLNRQGARLIHCEWG